MRGKIAFVLLIAAAVCGYVGWQHWNAGTPPTWSYFGKRAETTVLVSEIRDETDADGKSERLPHVEVAWPPGTDGAVTLRGVIPNHIARFLWTAEQLVGDYPPGQDTTVRIVGNLPFADHTDITEMTYAVFFSVLAAMGLIGATLIAMRRPGKGEDRA